MQRKKIVSLLILAFIGIAVLQGIGRLIQPSAVRDAPGYVAVIYLEGTIVGGRGQSALLAAAGGTDAVIRQLDQAIADPAVAAVVLRINSPGGTAAASQEVYQAVLRVREAGKPLVASFADMAASGGYWIACAADLIVANPASITGSIGVIMEVTDLTELLDKLGIDREVITSGEHKDLGSRPLVPAEREILQSMVDDIYQQFVDVVAEGRNMDRDTVLELADGRIFTGRQAADLGLVDALGDMTLAVDLASELSGSPRPLPVREMGRRSLLELLFGETNIRLFGSWDQLPGLEPIRWILPR